MVTTNLLDERNPYMINKIKQICEERKIPLKLHDPQTVSQLLELALSMGYEPICEEVDVDGELTLVPYGTDDAILIQLRQDINKYNNGVYFYKQINDAYVLEVLIPNTADKGPLVHNAVASIENYIATLEVADLDVYDVTKVFSHVLANSVFPESELRQRHFVDIYFPRFLANIARYHLGDSQLREETVNTEPFVVKLMIEGNESLGLVASPETTKKDGEADV